MKKKLLSLVLAGAMVASTSVSAFAESVTTITKPDTEEPTVNVKVTGEVLNEGGVRPNGNFNVTVPTAASFTVSKENGVISVPIKVQNNGTQDIDVYAQEFVDSTKKAGEGITVVDKAGIASQNRTYVTLKLIGGVDTAYLKTESNGGSGKGVYTESGVQADSEGIKIAHIQREDSEDLTLSGESGKTGEVSEGVRDTFTLTLKIKKAQ